MVGLDKIFGRERVMGKNLLIREVVSYSGVGEGRDLFPPGFLDQGTTMSTDGRSNFTSLMHGKCQVRS